MTTTARPRQGQPRERAPGVLLVAGVCVLAAVAVATVVAGLAAGSAGALGALVGGSIACGFFLFGSVVVNTASRIAPQAAMVTALLTYTLQIAVVALVFLALDSSGAVGTTLSAGWVAGGVIAATVAWTLGQLAATFRARIPVYDISLPGDSPASRPSTPQTASEAVPEDGACPREVGAP